MVTYTTTSPSHRDVPARTQTTRGAAEPTDALTAARAEALFASYVPMHSTLTPEEFRAAVRDALLRHHGVPGCAAEVAAAYGDCPETAVPRMRWARQVVQSMYGEPVRPVPAARRRPGSGARELTLA